METALDYSPRITLVAIIVSDHNLYRFTALGCHLHQVYVNILLPVVLREKVNLGPYTGEVFIMKVL